MDNAENERGFGGQDLTTDEGLHDKGDPRSPVAVGQPIGEPTTYDWREEQRIYNRRLALEHAVRTEGKHAKGEKVIGTAGAYLSFLEG